MSQIDRFISFAFSHQTLVIEGIFATILAIIVIWLFSSLQDEEVSGNKDKNQAEIEATLKRVLASAQFNPVPPAIKGTPPAPEKISPPKVTTAASQVNAPIPNPMTIQMAIPTAPQATTPPLAAPVVASVAAPAPGAPNVAPAPVIATSTPTPIPAAPPSDNNFDLARLRNDIESRNKRVDELEKLLSVAQGELKKSQDVQSSSTTLDDLRKQVATLEARLKEYSIIEDDIANLSQYKDENDKLKGEIEILRMKGKGAEPQELIAPETPSLTATPLTGYQKEKAPEGEGPSWPLNEDNSKKLIKEFDDLLSKSAATEILDQANAKEGEKLIADFENFMKGSG